MLVTKKKTNPVRVIIIACFVVVLFVIVAASGSSDDVNAVIKNMSPEEKLAVLDKDGPVDKDSRDVTRIRVLLNTLSDRFHEPVDSIAEQTSRGQGMIQDEGVQITNLEILEGVKAMGTSANKNYTDAIAMFVVLTAKANP